MASKRARIAGAVGALLVLGGRGGGQRHPGQQPRRSRSRCRRSAGATSSRWSAPPARSSPSATSTSARTPPAASSQLARQGRRPGAERARCWPASSPSATRRATGSPRRRCRRPRPSSTAPLADLEVGAPGLRAHRRRCTRRSWSPTRPTTRPRPTSRCARPASRSQRRRIAQLQAQLDSTRDDLEKTTVLSPMDGVVTSLPKEEGEVVIGAQSFSPTVIMTVADLSVMECEIMVDETDIRHLALGQPARGAGGRPRGPAHQGRGHRDRLLGGGAGLHRRPRRQTSATNTAQPGQGLQGQDHPQGPAALASARA